MNALALVFLVASQVSLAAGPSSTSGPGPQEAAETEPAEPKPLISISPERNPIPHIALGLGGTTLLVGGAVAALSPVFFSVEPQHEPTLRWAGVVTAGVGVSMLMVSALLFTTNPDEPASRTGPPFAMP